MYFFPGMIEIGLKKGETFKTNEHRIVCVNLGIARPGIDTADQLVDIVTAVNQVPTKRIKSITLQELRNEFKMNYV